VGSLHANAPAFLGTAMVVCRDFATAYLQVHFPNTHGGLTPAALVNERPCIAKGVIFTENTHRSLHQQRGASAPRGFANALTSAFRAHYRRRSPDDTHGGLTEGTVVRAYGCCRAMIHFCSTPSVLPSHGGVTPAALVSVRLCTAKIVIFRRTVVATRQERGASAPRGLANALASAFRAHYRRRSPDDTHGGLTQGAVVRPFASWRTCWFCAAQRSYYPATAG
jgi:hypothetical protein